MVADVLLKLIRDRGPYDRFHRTVASGVKTLDEVDLEKVLSFKEIDAADFIEAEDPRTGQARVLKGARPKI